MLPHPVTQLPTAMCAPLYTTFYAPIGYDLSDEPGATKSANGALVRRHWTDQLWRGHYPEKHP